MKLSLGATYAIYGLQYLARKYDEVVPVKEIAKNFQFPEKHMAKIFQNLVKAGLLLSERGIGGGFRLAKKPEKINLIDIIVAVDGPIIAKGCFLNQTDCKKLHICKTAKLIQDAQLKLIDTFEKITLEQLIDSSSECP